MIPSALDKLVKLVTTNGGSESAIRFIQQLDEHNLLESLIREAENITKEPEQCLFIVAKAILSAVEGHSKNTQIAVSDITGETPRILQQAFTRSRDARAKAQGLMSHRHCGSKSHQVATLIYTKKELLEHHARVFDDQPRFWETEPFLTSKLTIRSQKLSRMKKLLRQAIRCDGSENLFYYSSTIDLLAKELELFIGEDCLKSFNRDRVILPRLYALSVLSWAQLLVSTAEERPYNMVTELDIIDGDHWISGGRIDALCPVTRTGLLPRSATLHRFRTATARKPRDLVELIRRLPCVGRSLFFRVDDYKFQIGDAVDAFGELSYDEILVKPPSKHLNQMKRYLTMSNVAYRRAKRLKRTRWDIPVIQEARLIYVFAHHSPVIHRVTMSPEERLEYYNQYRELRTDLEEIANLRTLAKRSLRTVRKTPIVTLFD